MKWSVGAASLFQHGPIIEILIKATGPEIVEGKAFGLEYPEFKVKALIDTGASLTIINPQIAVHCKLLNTDSNIINAVGGRAGEFPAFAASISFPGADLPGFEVVRVVACPIVRQPFFSCLLYVDGTLLTTGGRAASRWSTHARVLAESPRALTVPHPRSVDYRQHGLTIPQTGDTLAC